MRIKRKFKLKLMKMRKSLRWGFVWHVRWGWINFKWATQGREGAEESGKAGDSAARRVWKPATTRRLSAWNVCAFNLISSANLHVCSPCRKWRRRMRRHSQTVWLFFSLSLPLSPLLPLSLSVWLPFWPHQTVRCAACNSNPFANLRHLGIKTAD